MAIHYRCNLCNDSGYIDKKWKLYCLCKSGKSSEYNDNESNNVMIHDTDPIILYSEKPKRSSFLQKIFK